MSAYFRSTLDGFLKADAKAVVGQIQTAYARDGFATQYSSQSRSWAEMIPLLQNEVRLLLDSLPVATTWAILLEFPLYRLQRRIDIVVLAKACVAVIEAKVGAQRFSAGDERQVEEYALDLRDFHEGSRGRPIIPILWATHGQQSDNLDAPFTGLVAPICRAGRSGLARELGRLAMFTGADIVAERWDTSVYRPVPGVIHAATTIFAGHDVRSIAQADASNLREAARRLVELIVKSRSEKRRSLIFLTGVPGSGKTLAGLQVVHDALETAAEEQGDIVYLSGNTPLVTVLREALARDEHSRSRFIGAVRSLRDIRRDVRARIQHINDFLKQSLSDGTEKVPHEHAIVFDEAQRAWDERQGVKKFYRTSSEPMLILQLMGRHADWCSCVCLVGGGQEINTGEQGVTGWGDAIRSLSPEEAARWEVFGPPDVVSGGPSTGGDSLGALPHQVSVTVDTALQLEVPLRAFRSPALNSWVIAVLSGDAESAKEISLGLGDYPLLLTRSLSHARTWLQRVARGERRYGLAASSGSRRLRADGLGEILNATDGIDIAHWYLNPPGDIRSSYALEVPANEYTFQGLELDFVALCWGGDFVRDHKGDQWIYRRLNGTHWQTVKDTLRRKYLENGYRVLLTRAREGLVIWVPTGDRRDSTRDPALFDATASYLRACGVDEYLPGNVGKDGV